MPMSYKLLVKLPNFLTTLFEKMFFGQCKWCILWKAFTNSFYFVVVAKLVSSPHNLYPRENASLPSFCTTLNH